MRLGFLTKLNIKSWQLGLLYRKGEPERILEPGAHWLFDPALRTEVFVVSTREAPIFACDLDVLTKSGLLEGRAEVLDLADHERALVWIDDRFEGICGPGLHGFWTAFHDVRVELCDTQDPRLKRSDLGLLLAHESAFEAHGLESVEVPADHLALVYVDGRLAERLEPGRHAFWRAPREVRHFLVDLREQSLDVPGQELMTADRVTLRLNAQLSFRVIDAEQAVSQVSDFRQALYREAQLALREVVGGRELDGLLEDKHAVSAELAERLRERARSFGVKVVQLGIRDIILPGDMKELLNKVTEAKKAAEAAVITRREEVGAMRSQANTAKLLASNPTLMRLRELEVLEKVTEKANLTVVLGDQSLSEKVTHLL